VSQDSDVEVVAEAFGVGGGGYVLKTDAGSQKLAAIHYAIRGQTFICTSLLDRALVWLCANPRTTDTPDSYNLKASTANISMKVSVEDP